MEGEGAGSVRLGLGIMWWMDRLRKLSSCIQKAKTGHMIFISFMVGVVHFSRHAGNDSDGNASKIQSEMKDDASCALSAHSNGAPFTDPGPSALLC